MKRKLLVTLLTLLLAFCSLGLFACSDSENEPEHEHSYQSEWSHDGEYHWKKCKTADCDEVSQKEEHTFVDGVCSVCLHEDTTTTPENEPEPPNNYSEGLSYSLSATQDYYTVTGIGTFNGTELNIPSTYNNILVTSIGNYAFSNCSALTSIIIPDSVTKIGDYAFNRCWALTSITIPNSVTKIGRSAFSACSSLTSIIIPDSVINIGDSAFEYCSALTNIIANENNENYASQDGILYNKTKTRFIHIPQAIIGPVTIPDSITSIDNSAFNEQSALTSITIPDSVISIGERAFYNCDNLTSITIPDSVTSLGKYAFAYCDSLTNVTIGESVISIGDMAFENCESLTSITIPNSVTSIDDSPFYKCSALTNVNYTGTIDQWAMIDFEMSDSNPLSNAKHLYINGVEVTEVNLTTATYISDYAFDNCESITSVTIGDSVTDIGSYAFYNCSALTSITIPDSVTSIGSNAFQFCYKLLEVINKSELEITATSYGLNALQVINDEKESKIIEQDGYIFYNDNGSYYLLGYKGTDTKLTLPDKINGNDYAIYMYAFNSCKSITSITIPDSVTSIGSCAFRNCSALTSVTISNSVTFIGEWTFNYCDSLTSITVDENNLYYSSVDGVLFNKNKTFLICYPNGKSGAYVIPNSVTSIGGRAFYNCSALTSVTIPDSVTSIGDDAFYNCSALTSITIPDSVTSIDRYAFSGCSALTSVTIPDSVTSIGYEAFEGCNNLQYNLYDNAKYLGDANNPYLGLIEATDTSITSCEINPNCKFIASSAFYNCSALTSVNYTGTIDQWAMIDFYAYTSNPLYYAKHLYINGVEVTEVNLTTATYISNSAFSGCENITSVTIPDSVTSIGDDAFRDCTALTRVDYTGTIDQWAMIEFASSDSNPLYYTEHLYINGVEVTEVNLTTATYISDYAFYNCESITNVTIGDSVTNIGDYVFRYCSALTSVTIGDNVTSIGCYAICYCSSLTSVTFADANTWYHTSSSLPSGGTQIDVTDSSNNATYLNDTYYYHYWYKV